MSPFWKFLHLLFHYGRVWRLHRNSLRYLTQNSFAMCWMHLHLLLLNSSAFINWPGGGRTALDFIDRIWLGHSSYTLWTYLKVSTVSRLEFNTASVCSISVFNDSSFNDLPCHECSRETTKWSMLTESTSLKYLPCNWMLLDFCAKWCNLHQYLEGNTESSDDPFLWRCFLVLSVLQQNWTHCHYAEPWCSLFLL